MNPNWNALQRWWMFDDPRSNGARSILHWAAEGLRIIGKSVSVCPLDPTEENSIQSMRIHLEESQPDVVLLANHPAATFWARLGYQAPQCPTIVWVFDDPALMGGEPFGEDELVWVADPSFAEGAWQRGAKRVQFVPVAAPDRVDVHPEETARIPVVYVGATLRLTAMRDQLAPDMAAYLDRVAEAKANQPGDSFEALLESIVYQPGKRIPLSGQLAYYLYTEANRRYRMKWLMPLASQGLHLYGNEAWREEIRGTELENTFGGGIEPLKAYPQLLANADVSLNIRSLQGIAAPTHRDFLVPAVGGFMLSTPLQKTLAFTGKDDPYFMDTFPWAMQAESPEALAEKVGEFVHAKERRLEWIATALEAIATHHTFSQRWKQVGEMWHLSGELR